MRVAVDVAISPAIVRETRFPSPSDPPLRKFPPHQGLPNHRRKSALSGFKQAAGVDECGTERRLVGRQLAEENDPAVILCRSLIA